MTAFAPPAWLPEDLLPESYRAPLALPAPTLSPPTVLENDSTKLHPPAPAPSRSGPRVLRWAALLGLLTWAGHSAWHGGHLTPLIDSLRGAVQRVFPASTPADAPPLIVTPDVSLSTLPPPAPETGASLVPQSPGAPSGPKITSQIER